ncbi:hypothetical protein IHE45_16G055000 [Dioscorea alata]|uniref:Uncharacterized protein n=1 Tax=Dioscorea alata TaxID=55571 RepID=A0ACB7UHQ0_DIOAL|nr:hypothetical protein IHE45_16G055000 [Dioscorea alata]
MVNVTHKLKTTEPYVLASQDEQVYYVRDIKEPNWQVVVKTKPHDLYDLPDDDIGDEPCQKSENFGFTLHESTLADDNDVIALDRSDLDAASVEGNPLYIDNMGDEEDEETNYDDDTFLNDNEQNLANEDKETADDSD